MNIVGANFRQLCKVWLCDIMSRTYFGIKNSFNRHRSLTFTVPNVYIESEQ